MVARATSEPNHSTAMATRARSRLRERAWKIPVAAVIVGGLVALATAGSTTSGVNDGRGAMHVLLATAVLATLGELASLGYYALDRRRRH